jgi:heme A synthase
MSLVVVHEFLSRAFLVFTGIVAIWSLYLFVQSREIGGDFWGTIVVGEGLVALQALVGGALVARGALPARGIHFLYGALCVLTWPAVYAFTQGKTGRREALAWGLVSVFLFGLAMRALTTG